MYTTISGYKVKVLHNKIPYTLYTEKGVRGINIPCVAEYTGDKWKVFVNGEEFKVSHATCDLVCEDFRINHVSCDLKGIAYDTTNQYSRDQGLYT